MKTIRRSAIRGGRMLGKFGHHTAKYSKNPRIKHGLALEGFRTTRKPTPIKDPRSSVGEAVRGSKRV